MANTNTQIPPMTLEERLAYAKACRELANQQRATDPKSAEINDWMAANYENTENYTK